MKDKKLVITLIAVIITVIIAALALGAYLLFRFSNVDGKIYNSQDIFENVDSFSIHVSSSKLYIFPTDEEKVTVIAENVKGKYTVQQNQKTLEVREGNVIPNINNTDSVIKVYVPENTMINAMEVETGAGMLIISNMKGMMLDIEQGAGKVELNDLDFSMLTIEAGTGEVYIKNTISNTLNVNAGVGVLEMDKVQFGRSKIEAGIGETKLSLVGARENYVLNIEKGIGSVTVDGKEISGNIKENGDGQKLDIECGIGNVDIEFVAPKGLEF